MTRRLLRSAAGVLTGAALADLAIRRHIAALPSPAPDGIRPGQPLTFPATTTHRIDLGDGAAVDVADTGGDGPVVVALHGYGLNARCWGPLATALARDGIRTLALDQRGSGASTAVPPQVTVDMLADDVRAVLDTLDLTDVTIVGQSLGGFVAQRAVLADRRAQQHRVSRLVLMNTAAKLPGTRLAGLQAAVMEMPLLWTIGRNERYGLLAVAPAFGPDTPRALLDAVRRAGLEDEPRNRRGLVRALLGIDISADLADFDLPTMVLAGELDRFIPASETLRLLAELPQVSLRRYPGAAHSLMLERPDEVARDLAEFMRDADVVPITEAAS